MYAELLFELVGSYASVVEELQMKRGEIAKLANKLVFLFQQINSADKTFDEIRTSLVQFKHSFVCLSQEVYAQLQNLLARVWTVNRTFQLRITKLLPLTLVSKGHQLANVLPIQNYSTFQTFLFLLFGRLLSVWRVFYAFLPLYLILRIYFKTKV